MTLYVLFFFFYVILICMIQLLKKINSIISRRDKKILALIIVAIFINAFFDLIGISAILPILTLLQEGSSAIPNNTILRIFSSIFSTTDQTKLTSIILLFFSLFYLFKVAYGVFVVYITNKFTLGYTRKLTKRLMEVYLSFPYEYHLDNNSSTLIRKSTYDVDNFTNALNDLMKLLTKGTVTLVLTAYLFITDYRVALIVGGGLFLFSMLVLLVIKPHLRKISKKAQKLNNYNYQFLSQAFNGVKESKISNTESFFVNSYDKNREGINKQFLKKFVINSVPVGGIELIGIIGICISLSVLLLMGETSTAIISTFAVFVYAVIKLLPALTEIASVFNGLNFAKASVDSLYNDIELSKKVSDDSIKEKNKILPFEKNIELKNVTFFYQSNPERKILNNISVKIEKNTSVAFSGVSGAGKTTVIDIILGLLPCREGQVLCDGVDISSAKRGWRSNISYIPQNIYLCDDSIRRNIAFGIEDEKINDEKIWDALEKAQLSDYVKGLPEGLDTIIGERDVRMSCGQRQRLGIARAFYRDTNIIVFDEATSALDYETEKNILDHVSKYSKDHTLIIITHRLNTIESCDHIYKVNNGSLEVVK